MLFFNPKKSQFQLKITSLTVHFIKKEPFLLYQKRLLLLKKRFLFKKTTISYTLAFFEMPLCGNARFS